MKKLISIVLCAAALCACAGCKTKTLLPDAMPLPTPTATADPFVSGEISNGVFTSKYSGIKITPPSQEWSFASEEEILKLMNIALESDILTDEIKKHAQLIKQRTVYDCVLKKDSGSNLIVMYENLDGTDDIDGREYLESVKKQFISLGTGTAGNVTKETLAGKSYYRLNTVAEYSGVTMDQTYFCRKLDKRVLIIILTGVPAGSDETNNMISMISGE